MQQGLTGGDDRDVFEDWTRQYETPQLRLKPQERTNEVVVLNRDDVGLKCPALLPREAIAVPPPPAAGGACGVPPRTVPGMGDGYIANFGANQSSGLGTFFSQAKSSAAAAAPVAKWYFPADPQQGALGLVRATPAGNALGPVDAAVDPTKCVPASDRLRLMMGGGAAGAITGIRYAGYEYIKQAPSGTAPRAAALQISVASNIPSGGHDQQRRANEAGGSWNQGLQSSSRPLVLASGRMSGNKRLAAYTRAQASWWQKPGATVAKRKVLNAVEVSPFEVAKRVVLDRDSFILNQGVAVPAAENASSLRIASRITVNADLNRAMAFHVKSQRWQVLTQSRTLEVGRYGGLLVTNADGTHALGFTLTDFPKPPPKTDFMPKAFYAVNVTNKKAEGTVLSVVHQLGVRGWARPLPARMYSYHTTWHAGSLAKVSQALAALAINLSPESQALEAITAKKKAADVCRPPLKKWVNHGLLTDKTLVSSNTGKVCAAAPKAPAKPKTKAAPKPTGCTVRRDLTRCQICGVATRNDPGCKGCVTCKSDKTAAVKTAAGVKKPAAKKPVVKTAAGVKKPAAKTPAAKKKAAAKKTPAAKKKKPAAKKPAKKAAKKKAAAKKTPAAKKKKPAAKKPAKKAAKKKAAKKKK